MLSGLFPHTIQAYVCKPNTHAHTYHLHSTTRSIFALCEQIYIHIKMHNNISCCWGISPLVVWRCCQQRLTSTAQLCSQGECINTAQTSLAYQSLDYSLSLGSKICNFTIHTFEELLVDWNSPSQPHTQYSLTQNLHIIYTHFAKSCVVWAQIVQPSDESRNATSRHTRTLCNRRS